MTLWLDDEAIQSWCYTGPSQQGAQYTYGEAGILCGLTLRAVYHLPLRATQGLIASVVSLLGVALPIPHYSTLSRRAATVEVELGSWERTEPLHLVVDSSGFKIYGEGEWKVRQHGWSKRRTWRKLHIGVNEATGGIEAAVLSTATVSDEEGFPEVLEQVADEIEQVSADGAYDKRRCYKAIEERGAKAVIPPRRDAKIWQQGNCAAPPLQRDANLRGIRAKGRRRWKVEAGYHRRSLAETAIFRLKTIFGAMVRGRTFLRQATELFLKVAALNRMTQLGMPDSYLVPA